MKKLILACAFILCISVLGGCSKDDGPSSAKVKGSLKVDGKKADLKYGYFYYEDDEIEYIFCDKDVLKYMDEDGDVKTGVEFTALWLVYDEDISNIAYMGIDFKVNNKGGGTYYEYPDADAYNHLSFSAKNGSVKSSSNSIPVVAYDFDENEIGSSNASFSVEGKTMDLYEYFSDRDDNTRSIPVTEVTDQKQISILRSLRLKH